MGNTPGLTGRGAARSSVLIAMLVLAAGSAGPRLRASSGSELIEAIKADDLAAARALVKRAGAVNAVEPDGTTPLFWAARTNNVAAVRLLLSAGANARAANRYGETPLSLAAINGNAAIIEALIKAGADPNASNPDGQTVLMTAARTGVAGAIQVLLRAGADPDRVERVSGENALMWAAAENHGEAVTALIEAGARVDTRAKLMNYPPLDFTPGGMITHYMPVGGMTPLMYAARNGAGDAVRALLDRRADLRQVDGDGTTATIFAIINGHFDVAEQIVERSAPADLDVQDRTGMTALYAAVEMHSVDPTLGRPLPPVRGDNVRLVKRILERGANPNLTLRTPIIGRHHNANGDGNLGAGTTALMRAARNGDVELAKMLLTHGADPRLTQADGTNALMIAASPTGGPGLAGQNGRLPAQESTCLEVIALLATAGVDINAQNEAGDTAMHRAATRGRDETVEGLAKLGARMNITNERGQNVLDAVIAPPVARRGGPPLGPAPSRESTIALLRQLGAVESVRPAGPGPAAQPRGVN